ncbi:MAG TPA: amino acid ABC transporter substrate-binding protein [Actinomycetota bacterium]|nr:amino acid ABC transporter substrate-binding protein [Actinomycetota bacterium]
MQRTVAKWLIVLAALSLVAVACDRDTGGDSADEGGSGDSEQAAAQEDEGGSLIDEIQDRGTLRCGVNNTVPGFGFDPGTGEIEGFDIDFCRGLAAAVVGDPEAIELVPIDADNRFIALRDGEFDVLVRNTTWTSSRDGTEGAAFAHVNFYDGQAMMVREGEFSSIDEMDGTNICVTTGTTTELNLADYFQERGLDFKPIGFEENPQLQDAFISGRCDGWTSDRSQLAGIRSTWPEDEGGPESLVILDEIMSKEPLAPAVLDGDSEWLDAVNWVVNGIILAEELGVTSENVEQMAENPPNGNVANLLGVPFESNEGGGAIDHGLALENTFMQDVIAAVGNYGEIFDRHLGPDSPLELERQLNALWTDGGLQYAMPFR